jgi:hypothetical protein
MKVLDNCEVYIWNAADLFLSVSEEALVALTARSMLLIMSAQWRLILLHVVLWLALVTTVVLKMTRTAAVGPFLVGWSLLISASIASDRLSLNWNCLINRCAHVWITSRQRCSIWVHYEYVIYFSSLTLRVSIAAISSWLLHRHA